MSEYTQINLKEDVDDQAPNFGLAPNSRGADGARPLELEGFGVTYLRVAPNFRIPFAHRHKQQEEVYVVVGGGGARRSRTRSSS